MPIRRGSMVPTCICVALRRKGTMLRKSTYCIVDRQAGGDAPSG